MKGLYLMTLASPVSIPSSPPGSSAVLSSPQMGHVVSCHPGVVVLQSQGSFEAKSESEAEAKGFLDLFEFPGVGYRMETWHRHLPVDRADMPGRLLGNFEMTRHLMVPGIPGAPYDVMFILSFPLWVPWLLFIAFSFVVCRFMEKRTVMKLKKALAQGHLSDRLPDGPA